MPTSHRTHEPFRRALPRVSAAIAGALVVALAVPSLSAVAAPPAAPTLVAPAQGSTTSGLSPTLSVRATDPDGDVPTVAFEGRKAGATAPGGGTADPFTLVVIPDTQNYTYSGRQGTITAQTRWVVDQRDALDVAFVAQLGDLVSNFDNATQWGYASEGFRILDDAGVPNSVVPGNHDFDNATKAVGLYDQYFPPSRYSNATWTPSTARYGGYLGQNLFGPDPVDRKNMDNFTLFSAGGRDYLILSLEWEAPGYALDWGRKVLAAHPDRIAILVTHSFVTPQGTRRATAQRTPDGTSPEVMWSQFVSQQCSIALVLSGHEHTSAIAEARRSDANRCGQQVPQILSDYQERANGGDGWLRYYTIDPRAGTLAAKTYSPTLGIAETDADSQFTIPFPTASAAPAPFAAIGSAIAGTDGTASLPWAGLEPDTTYEWRVTSSDGNGTSTSPTWTFRTPPATPPPGPLARDDFSRTATGGWGTADAGGAWTVSAPSSWSVSAGAGRVALSPGASRQARLGAVSVLDSSTTVDLAMSPAMAGAGIYASVLARSGGTSSYRAKLRVQGSGTPTLAVTRAVGGTETTLATVAVPGLVLTQERPVRIRLEVSGTSPATIRAKAWQSAGTEPAGWQVSATDSTAALQTAGAPELLLYLSSSEPRASTAIVDGFRVDRLGGTPPPPPPSNARPVAEIGTPTVTGRTVTVNGSGSSDPDGSVLSWSWAFGDGGTATGASASHSYASDGTYPITLTVLDDDGASGTVTRNVTIATTGSGLARDTFGRTLGSGWGSAEAGGPWTVSGTSSRYSVGDGVGRILLDAPGRTGDALLLGASADRTELRSEVSWSRTGTAGTLYTSFLVRRTSGTADYRLKVVVGSANRVSLTLVRRVGGVETALASAQLPSSVTVAAGTRYSVAVQAVQSGGTTGLAAKLWRTGTAEPGWAVTAQDATPAALAGAGGVGVQVYESGSATANVTTSFDELTVSRLG
ncbi:MAG: domain containing protein [Naasia sp.]|nr:domain containing protein [Naasia sp.]